MAPVTSVSSPGYHIALFGGHPSSSSFSPQHDAMAWAKQRNGYGLHHMIHPPSNERGVGFREIAHHGDHADDFIICADGYSILSGQAVAVRSGDCPIVTAYNPLTNKLAVTHAGRAALNPTLGDQKSVINHLLSAVARNKANREWVQVYVTGAICGGCFQHEHTSAQHLIAPFRERYPDAIVGDHGLDLVAVIRQECVNWGIPEKNVAHDMLCTKEHAGLASYRNGDTARNLTVIIHR